MSVHPIESMWERYPDKYDVGLAFMCDSDARSISIAQFREAAGFLPWQVENLARATGTVHRGPGVRLTRLRQAPDPRRPGPAGTLTRRTA